MFKGLMYPSSGACDCVESPHRSSCSVKMDDLALVVVQQHSRKLLMMDILMSETC